MLCEWPRRSCRRRELLNQPWIGACSQPPLRAIGTKREGGIAGDIPAGGCLEDGAASLDNQLPHVPIVTGMLAS